MAVALEAPAPVLVMPPAAVEVWIEPPRRGGEVGDDEWPGCHSCDLRRRHGQIRWGRRWIGSTIVAHTNLERSLTEPSKRTLDPVALDHDRALVLVPLHGADHADDTPAGKPSGRGSRRVTTLFRSLLTGGGADRACRARQVAPVGNSLVAHRARSFSRDRCTTPPAAPGLDSIGAFRMRRDHRLNVASLS